MRRDTLLVLEAIHELGARLDARLDAINLRLDRLTEQVAGLTVDVATHGHDGTADE
jgi:uncharacterized protein HemX